MAILANAWRAAAKIIQKHRSLEQNKKHRKTLRCLNFLLVRPRGIEPPPQVPETCALSTGLRAQLTFIVYHKLTQTTTFIKKFF